MKPRCRLFLLIGLAATPAGVAIGQGNPPPSVAPLSADEARRYNTLKFMWTHGDTADRSAAKVQFREAYLKTSAEFLADYPNHPEIYVFRAVAALELNLPPEGQEAGRKLKAFGYDRSTSPQVQNVLAQLASRGWYGEPPPPGARASAPIARPVRAKAPPPPLFPAPEEPRPFAPLPPAPALAALAGQDLTAPSAGLPLLWVRPGTFWMGDNQTKPITTVHLTRGYWLGKYLVTQAQWRAIIGSNPSSFKEEGLNAPVDQVSWDDAVVFCRRLTARERAAGRVPDGYEYRLPTEAEWEYACRAGTTTDFPDGKDVLPDVAWFQPNSGGHTHPVGEKEANAWGFYDMHGNVWEWCADWFGPYPGGEVTDPTGPAAGETRVNRGGCWQNEAGNCRSSRRHSGKPDYVHRTEGLRVALAPVLPPPGS